MALGLIDDVEQVDRLIAQHPDAGSPRYAFEMQIANLLNLRLKRYPYLIFYVERPDHVDVWRVLHGTRDIPI
ncbi:type II toxin-antitoxin system RelE/ParE family toxin [Ancylobacter sp. VNQ12]|uniref:type II toxin-antitoxin system RelE/ParE family toxin n=1 Tax=Ancylobacter sp. VNQ12 TaxID=3400920 RepID=UPI003C110629